MKLSTEIHRASCRESFDDVWIDYDVVTYYTESMDYFANQSFDRYDKLVEVTNVEGNYSTDELREIAREYLLKQYDEQIQILF